MTQRKRVFIITTLSQLRWLSHDVFVCLVVEVAPDMIAFPSIAFFVIPLTFPGKIGRSKINQSFIFLIFQCSRLGIHSFSVHREGEFFSDSHANQMTICSTNMVCVFNLWESQLKSSCPLINEFFFHSLEGGRLSLSPWNGWMRVFFSLSDQLALWINLIGKEFSFTWPFSFSTSHHHWEIFSLAAKKSKLFTWESSD